MDFLGNRMKEYEKSDSKDLTRKLPVIIRVDGRAFHTFLKGARKPYDAEVITAMIGAADRTRKDFSGFKLAYIQSDEASFMIWDNDKEDTQAWFGNDQQKLISVTCSLFTGHFNRLYTGERRSVSDAVFDARAFVVPPDDVANYFVWRQKDWIRNSIQMFARGYFDDKQLYGKSNLEIVEKLFRKGVDWNLLPEVYKFGTYITRNEGNFHGLTNYHTISDYLRIHPLPVVVESEEIPVEEE